jgi:hypothetical protein
VFAAGTGANVGDYEKMALQQFNANTPSIQGSADPSGRVLDASTSTATAGGAGGTPASGSGAYGPAALLNDFNIQKQGALNTAGAATTAGGSQLGSSIQDLIDSLKGGQRNIDAESVNNDLAKTQGHQSILDMVGNGIRSGGVMLANKNAGNSSAAQALANAYGLLGRQQESKVGNQFEQGQNKIAADQFNQDQQAAQGSRHIQENKTGIINNIVSTAQNSLTMLNSAMAGANLPDRIDIQKEIDTVKANAMQQLQQYDSMLSQGVGGVQAMNPNDAQAKAASLAAAGTAAPDQFNYTTDAPLTEQNTGPFASALPLFTLGNKKTNA